MSIVLVTPGGASKCYVAQFLPGSRRHAPRIVRLCCVCLKPAGILRWRDMDNSSCSPTAHPQWERQSGLQLVTQCPLPLWVTLSVHSIHQTRSFLCIIFLSMLFGLCFAIKPYVDPTHRVLSLLLLMDLITDPCSLHWRAPPYFNLSVIVVVFQISYVMRCLFFRR